MFDTIIRGGTLVDGSGDPRFTGDIGIVGGRIAEVGGRLGAAHREIDAHGAIVTPGWVDVHTHYDGQVTWDPYLSPSTDHGVTSVVMGNCGVGFAPVHRDRREWLISVMEGVEDIPAPCWPRASTGNGRASPSTSTRSSACRARSTSARRSRTRRCAPT